MHEQSFSSSKLMKHGTFAARSHDLPVSAKPSPNSFPVLVVVGQDVVDLAVLELAHVIFDGIA